jgi:hypothetical protein
VLPQPAQPAGQPLRTLKIQIPDGLNILFPSPLFLFPKGFELMRPSARPMCCIIGGILMLFARPTPAQTAPDIDADRRPPKVAPLFEQPGVLTPRGTYVLEPAVQYAYSSSDRIAIAGYALIATLLPPRIDVREARRNSTIASLTARAGITNRFEVELRVPYVYRSDAMVSRDVSGGVATDRVVEASGKAIGDAEFAARYQLNEGGLIHRISSPACATNRAPGAIHSRSRPIASRVAAVPAPPAPACNATCRPVPGFMRWNRISPGSCLPGPSRFSAPSVICTISNAVM